MMDWSIIIFCYNEEQNIENVVMQSLAFINRMDSDSEILIVDDGSTDSSAEIIEDCAMKDSRVKVVRHFWNRGIGEALKTGYEAASKEYVCAVPADGQFSIDELRKIPEFTEDCFFAFYRESKNYNIYRNILTNFNYMLNRYVLNNNIKDVNWIKVYRKKHLVEANPQLRSSLIESEISSKLLKRDIKCIGVESAYLPREYGKSKGGNVHTVSRALLEMLRLIIIVKKF